MFNHGPAYPVAKPGCAVVLISIFCSVDFSPCGCTLISLYVFQSCRVCVFSFQFTFHMHFCNRSLCAAPAAKDKPICLWLRHRPRHSEGLSILILITPQYDTCPHFFLFIIFSQKRSASAHSTLLQSNQLLLCFVLHTQESYVFCSKRKHPLVRMK